MELISAIECNRLIQTRYKLIPATQNDVDNLIQFKLNNIFNYATDMIDNEIEKIKKYVKTNILKQLKNYKIIVVDNQKVGCVLVENYQDGQLLNEIYIEDKYRNKGIGTAIIKTIQTEITLLYLWVYKENLQAQKLYSNLGFIIEQKTKSRYLMKYTS